MGITPCAILSLPPVLGEIPLKILWLVQAGWKVLPGPRGSGDVSFPCSWCFLTGRYAREGLARFGSS